MATQQIEIRVLDKTQRALSNVSQRLSNLNKGLLGVNRVAGLAATALGAIGGASVVSNIVKTTARFEDLRTTLSTVTGGARQGAEAFDFIAKFSTQTQFGVEELTQTFIKLKASGIEPTTDLLTLFTDAAAVTTDQLGSLQAITDLFSRTTAGGLGLEELNRLADRGIPVFDILQEKLGRNRLQLSDLGKTAEGANLILTALSDGIRERFGGATLNRINNVSTQFSNLQIAIANAADQIGSQGFAKALGQTAVELTNFIENNKQLVQEIGVNLTKSFLFAKEAMVLVIKNIDLLGKAFAAFIGLKIALAVGSIAFAFGSTFVKGVVLATRAIKAMSLAAAANPIIATGLAIAAGVEYLTGAFSKLAEKMNLGGVADEALDALEKGFDNVAGKIGANIDGLEEFQNNISNISKKAEELAPKFENIQVPADQIKTSAEKTNTAIGKTNESLKAQANELAVTKKTFEEVLRSVEKQNALQTISLEKDAVKQALMRAELDIGRQLTKEEAKQLSNIVKQTTELQKQADLQKQIDDAITAYASEMAKAGAEMSQRGLFGDLEQEQKRLDDTLNYAYSILKARFEAEQLTAKQILDAKLQIDNEYQRRLDEITMKGIERRLQFEKAAIAKSLSEKEKEALQRIGVEERQQEIVRNRIEFEKKSEAEKVQFGLEQATTLFTGLSKVNKKFFAAQKAAAIALAIVNTYQGATKALATYPPPFNFIAAAATVASGLAQVATIRAQTMQRGGALPGGQAAIVGEDGPELIVPKQSSTVIPREVADALKGMQGGQGEVNVNFNITTVDAASFDQLLVERRGTIVGLINQAVERRGRVGVV